MTERGGSQPFYEFGKDDDWEFQGVALKDHKPRIRWAFRWTVLLVGVIECLLAAWPIAATVVWTLEASLTWIWFLYVPRVLFLLWALITASEVITLFGAGHRAKGNFLRTVGAFAPSTTLAVWTVFAWIGGAVIGTMFVIATAAVFSFFDSTLLYGLSLGIGALSVLESVVAPFVIYRFGVYIPIVKAHRIETGRSLRKMRTTRSSPLLVKPRGRKLSSPKRSKLSTRTAESRLRKNRGVLNKKRTRLN